MVLTKWDKIFIALIMIFSLCGIYFVKFMTFNDKNLYLIIQVDGKEYKKISIDASTPKQTITIDTSYGHNVIMIKGTNVKMIESDCKDQCCIKKGAINKVNQMIICLPNRISLQLVANHLNIDDISY